MLTKFLNYKEKEKIFILCLYLVKNVMYQKVVIIKNETGKTAEELSRRERMFSEDNSLHATKTNQK